MTTQIYLNTGTESWGGNLRYFGIWAFLKAFLKAFRKPFDALKAF